MLSLLHKLAQGDFIPNDDGVQVFHASGALGRAVRVTDPRLRDELLRVTARWGLAWLLLAIPVFIWLGYARPLGRMASLPALGAILVLGILQAAHLRRLTKRCERVPNRSLGHRLRDWRTWVGGLIFGLVAIGSYNLGCWLRATL